MTQTYIESLIARADNPDLPLSKERRRQMRMKAARMKRDAKRKHPMSRRIAETYQIGKLRCRIWYNVKYNLSSKAYHASWYTIAITGYRVRTKFHHSFDARFALLKLLEKLV